MIRQSLVTCTRSASPKLPGSVRARHVRLLVPYRLGSAIWGSQMDRILTIGFGVLMTLAGGLLLLA